MTHFLRIAAGLVLAAGPLAGQDSLRIVRGLSFEGNHAIDSYTLSTIIGTTNSSWFARTPPFRWLGLGQKREFDPVEFRRDSLRLLLYYRQSGFMEVQVDPQVRTQSNGVYLKIKIKEGKPIVVTHVGMTGLDSFSSRKKIKQDLPLRVGQPFNRFLLQASADSIAQRLRNRGYPAVEVFRNFTVDRQKRTATVSLDVDPGTVAYVSTIRVDSTKRVDSVFVRQLLTVRKGQRYSEERLYESQRKLYQSELFAFATVRVDTAQFDPASGQVPLVVNLSEGRPHRVHSSAGYATNDCFRASLGWTDRNLLGSGRLFDVSGRVSKVGVGAPTGWGLENSICSALKEDVIGSQLLNYNVTAQVRQPRFFSPLVTGTFGIFGERRSQFDVYRRDEIGISTALVRETARRVPVTLTYRLGYGRTDASAANFCAFFNACTPNDADRLRERKVLGVVGASIVWPRSNNLLDPSRGHVYSVEVAHSSSVTGSAAFQDFTRVTGDAAWYRQLSRTVVLSWHIRGGAIFAPRVSLDSASGNFIPPDERYYAGGPNDVRGYNLNELGPVVYVLNADSISMQDSLDLESGKLRPRTSATGGNTLGIAQIELRVPSPIFGRRLRLAFFVDAGTLFERGKTDISKALVRVTPGFGFRVNTPLGPARLDVGWNPYDLPAGALYLQKSDGTLELQRSNFQLHRGDHFSYHFTFGQPF